MFIRNPPWWGCQKKPKQEPRMSNVLCERASPAKELRARLRSEKGGMCHLAEVMTHAAVLLHLHRPSPRKCLQGGAPGAAWVAGRNKLASALGSPAAPAPTAGHSWLRLLRRPARSEPPGSRRGLPGEGNTGEGLSCGPHPFAVSFVRVRGVPGGGVRCSAAGCGNRRASFL